MHINGINRNAYFNVFKRLEIVFVPTPKSELVFMKIIKP